MRAWVLHDIGSLRYEERAVPEPEAGEVLLRVRAAGVCGSDIPRIYRTGAHVHPLVPGHEFAGTVAESTEPALKGRRVGVFPLIPCGTCAQCRRKRYEMCERYGYLGSRQDGGFAEYVRVPWWNLIELPAEVTFQQAALLEPLSVAVHAVRRSGVKPGDSAAVIGLGAIGLFVTALLPSCGVKTLSIVGNKPAQRTLAEAMGIPVDGWQTFLEAGGAFDVVFECVGLPGTASLAVSCAAPEGRVVTVGNPHGDMTFPRDTYWKILRNQLTLTGTWNSSFTGEPDDDWHRAMKFLQTDGERLSRVITHTLPLQELDRGLRMMRDKTEFYGKVMAVSDSE